jgi:DNA-binding transcriptional regulator YiaG
MAVAALKVGGLHDFLASDWDTPEGEQLERRPFRVARVLLTSVLTVAPLAATSNVIPLPSSYDVQTIRDWTSAGGFVVEPIQGIASAQKIKRLRSQSGLTWDEMARLFGVTRRSVHNWATGTRMNSRNMETLERVSAVIEEHELGNALATRAALMTPAHDGTSSYGRLVRLAARRAPEKPEGFAPVELLQGEAVPTPRGRPLKDQQANIPGA